MACRINWAWWWPRWRASWWAWGWSAATRDWPGRARDGHLAADPGHDGHYLRHSLQPVLLAEPALPAPGAPGPALRADRRAERHRRAGDAHAAGAGPSIELLILLTSGHTGCTFLRGADTL